MPVLQRFRPLRSNIAFLLGRNYSERPWVCMRPTSVRLLVVLSLLFATSSPAADRFWNDPAGGAFSTINNWLNNLPPGRGDVAHFGLSSFFSSFPQETYQVTFNVDPTNQAIKVEDDNVTLTLNSHVYTTTLLTGNEIGNQQIGKKARLTILDGTWAVANFADIAIGSIANSSGFLTVSTGGLIAGNPSLLVGKAGGGTLTIQNNGDILSDNTQIGNNAGAVGAATITGAGSSLFANTLNVGNAGTGTMTINTSGRVDDNSATIGNLSGSSGTASVDGTGSKWMTSGNLIVGNEATGALNITTGGQVTAASAILGSALGSTGAVNVDGINSKLAVAGSLTIGNAGAGTLNITGGGLVESGNVQIAHRDLADNPGSGAVTVSGLNSQWIVSGSLSVGINGAGTLDISGGGLVQSVSGAIGANGFGAAGSGEVHLSGPTSRWINSGELRVGDSYAGTLIITSGQVQNTNGFVGTFGPGAVTIAGTTSQWINLGDLTVGSSGIGTLDIKAGARVESVNGIIGLNQFGDGRVTVDGVGGIASWINSGAVVVGNLGKKATLEIKNGGQVQSTSGTVGSPFVTDAIVTVDGTGGGFSSQWVMSGDLRMNHDSAKLTISGGARVENANGTIGLLVNVSGANSRWTNLGDLAGDVESGTLNIASGGRVESVNGAVGHEVNVSGSGSQWINSGKLEVGRTAPGTMNVTSGGRVQNTDAFIATGMSSSGTAATVDGSGSQWISSGELHVGGLANGILGISGGGRVQCTNGFVGQSPFAGSGSISVAGADSTWTMSGQLTFRSGPLNIDPGGSVIIAHETIFDHGGNLNLQGGTFSTSEFMFLSGGNFNWTSGTLHVGSYSGNLTTPNDGTLAPGNSVGQTNIDGNYFQQSRGALEIEIGGPASADLVEITGVANLSGNLQLKLLGGFLPSAASSYVVFDSRGINGEFINVANGQRLTTADGLGSFLVHYGDQSTFDPTQIVLTNFLAAFLPGDYNRNGTVDAADYVVWRKTDGTQAGYDTWRSHFGQTAGSGVALPSTGSLLAVPEPSAVMLLILAAAGSLIRRNWVRGERCQIDDLALPTGRFEWRRS